ncbi:MAG: hypothetical protein RLZZ230_323, partial [Candidatus Parcubacteria bacterium]
IKERLDSGDLKDAVIEELHAAGYPEDLAIKLYNEVTLIVEEVVSMPTFQTETEIVKVKINTVPKPPTKPESSKPNKSFFLPVALGFAALFLIGGVAYGAMSGGFTKVGDFFSSLFQSAPYATEGEMMVGMVTAINQMKSYSVNSDYEIVFEPRASSTLVLSNEIKDNPAFADIETAEQYLPSEGYARFGLAGLVDRRDEQNPKVDIDMSLNVLFEPIMFSSGVGLRLADGNVYGRINDLPAMYEQFMPLKVPLKTWLLLYDSGDSSLIDNLPIFPDMSFPQVLNATSSPLAQLTSLQKDKLWEVAELISKVDGLNKINQLASAVAATELLDANGLTKEQLEMKVKVIALLGKYPIFKFVDKPQKNNLAGETVFDYQLDVDYDNFVAFGNALITEVGAYTEYSDTEGIAADFSENIPDREMFDLFNRLFDIKFSFRSDGTVQGVYVGAVITPTDAAVTQIRLRFETIFGKQDDAINITVPENIYEKSLKEIMEESMKLNVTFRSLDGDGNSLSKDKTASQSLNYINTYYYNGISSYDSICIDLKKDNMMLDFYSDVSYFCVNSDDSYMIYAPLESLTSFYCIDSTGVAVEIKSEPRAGVYKCPVSSVPMPPISE